MVDLTREVSVVVVLCVCFLSVGGFVHRRFHSLYNPNARHDLPSQYSYKTLYMTQNVDHFGFANDNTYQQRYLLADQFWNTDGGPLFFFTGGEGDITWFCNNTGFLWESGPEFKALLVFAEHRYYGESLPFGSDSFANNTVRNYLTVEQAMADFAQLIRYIKDTVPGAANSQVITVGGAYGGMLAAWMRLKYPNLVLGALASSAPIWQFTGGAPCGDFYTTLTNTYRTGSQQCVDNLKYLWGTLDEYWPGNLDFLTKTFSLCKPIEDKYALSDFIGWLSLILEKLAIVDYPYPASFLQPLPAWPVKEFCKPLSEPLEDDALVLAVSKGIKMYFNYTGQATCLNITQQATKYWGSQGWDYQTCTEIVMPVCSNNSEIIFNVDWHWQIQFLTEACKYNLGVTPRPDWIPLQFWGKHIQSASNIIFSNGELDPWSGGGVLQSLSPSLLAIKMSDAAQSLDLRAHDPADPAQVIAARQQEKNILKNWLYGEGR